MYYAKSKKLNRKKTHIHVSQILRHCPKKWTYVLFNGTNPKIKVTKTRRICRIEAWAKYIEINRRNYYEKKEKIQRLSSRK